MELFAILWMLTSLVASTQIETQQESNNTLEASAVDVLEERNSTIIEPIDDKKGKSERRAALFDTAESSPWVRVYNRPPGKQDYFVHYKMGVRQLKKRQFSLEWI